LHESRFHFHLETFAKLLKLLDRLLADFSKCALKSLENQTDFDSAALPLCCLQSPEWDCWRTGALQAGLCNAVLIRFFDSSGDPVPFEIVAVHLSPCRSVSLRAVRVHHGSKASYSIPNNRPSKLWPWPPQESTMPDNRYLTPDEVAERYRGGISLGTLRNWRAMRVGPSFVRIGKAILYPIEELDAWDQKNRVQCRASRRFGEHSSDPT
jgi:hypothetical protein